MRRVFRVVLVLAIVAMGTYLLGYWSLDQVMTGSWRNAAPAAGPPGTGTARERIGQLDARAAKAAHTVGDFSTTPCTPARLTCRRPTGS